MTPSAPCTRSLVMQPSHTANSVMPPRGVTRATEPGVVPVAGSNAPSTVTQTLPSEAVVASWGSVVVGSRYSLMVPSPAAASAAGMARNQSSPAAMSAVPRRARVDRDMSLLRWSLPIHTVGRPGEVPNLPADAPSSDQPEGVHRAGYPLERGDVGAGDVVALGAVLRGRPPSPALGVLVKDWTDRGEDLAHRLVELGLARVATDHLVVDHLELLVHHRTTACSH